MAEWQMRVGIFVAVLALCMLLEQVFARRVRRSATPARWASNFGLSGVNSLALHLLLPVSTVAFAAMVEAHPWSVFSLHTLPIWASCIVGFVLLDALIYFQHRVFHQVPLLWRIHKMHHTDLDLDASSGVRFHPVEAVLSALLRMAFVWLVGIPALALLVFEIVLNASAIFNHSNLRLAPWMERRLRCILVTPDMHRVHHSVVVVETNSNFGFCLPWWDRLCATYRAEPADGHEAMRIGLANFATPLTFNQLLKLPFTREEPQ